MAAARRDSDTLTRAEEEALARAKRAVTEGAGGGRRAAPARRSGRAAPGRGTSGRARSGRARTSAPARSATLDVVRGVGIVATVLLLAGAAPSELPAWASPSPWHGFEVADLVLPLFLLVAGASLAWSEARSAGAPAWRRAGRAARRLVVLVAAGLALNALAWDGAGELRWSGLLQRIGLATFVAWFLLALPRPWRIAALATTVVGWGFVLERVAAPGVGRGVLRPEENIVAWLDASLLGPEHLTAPTDPLGLATLPAAATLVVGGSLLGGWLRARPPGPATSAALAVSGGWLGVLGIGWAQVTPLNATLWTPPYLLFSAGVVLLLAAVVHLVVDVLPGARLLGPVGRLGRNPLVAYLVPAAVIAVAVRPGRDGTSAWARLVERFAAPVFGELAPFVLAGALLAVAWPVVRRLDDRGWHLRA